MSTSKYNPGDQLPTWRVGEFESSADPGKLVLMLATGEEIYEYEAHRDFKRWITPEPVDVDDLAHSAYEEGMAFGVSPDLFKRYFKGLVQRLSGTAPAQAPTKTNEQQSTADALLRRIWLEAGGNPSITEPTEQEVLDLVYGLNKLADEAVAEEERARSPLNDTQAELDAVTREMDVIYERWPSKDDRAKREELLTPLRARCVEIGQRRYRIAAGLPPQ